MGSIVSGEGREGWPELTVGIFFCVEIDDADSARAV